MATDKEKNEAWYRLKHGILTTEQKKDLIRELNQSSNMNNLPEIAAKIRAILNKK